MTNPSNKPCPLDIVTLLGLHEALITAESTGILKAALGTLRTAAEYAQELNLNERATERILEVLAAAGFLQIDGPRYGWLQTPSASSLPVPLVLSAMRKHFSHTPHWVRTGELLGLMDGTLEQREASYTSLVADMGRGFAVAATHLAAKLDLKPERILDVGCGSGVWSLEIAARVPGSHVTGVDFPTVLDAFKARAEQMGMKERIATIAGDMYDVAIPDEQFDLVIVANVVRLEPPDRARKLLSLLSRAVRPGGHMVVVDALAGGTPTKDLVRAVYALHLGLRTQVGMVHSPTHIRQWLQQAGLDEVKDIDCGVQVGAIGAIGGHKKPC